MVPILGVPDALVPIDLPVSQISLFPGYLYYLYINIIFLIPGAQMVENLLLLTFFFWGGIC